MFYGNNLGILTSHVNDYAVLRQQMVTAAMTGDLSKPYHHIQQASITGDDRFISADATQPKIQWAATCGSYTAQPVGMARKLFPR